MSYDSLISGLKFSFIQASHVEIYPKLFVSYGDVPQRKARRGGGGGAGSTPDFM